MIAPSGGFSPAGSSGGIGVSVFLFQRKRVTCCGANSAVTAARGGAAAICSNAVMSSKIQKLRPCVPSTMSSSLMTRSRIDVAGMFMRSDCQWSPSSKETDTCVSEPAKSKPRRLGSSRTTLMIAPLSSPMTISVQLFPPSRVRQICGRISSRRIVFTAAYAVFTSKCDASMSEILLHGAARSAAGVTSRQVFPPSIVT